MNQTWHHGLALAALLGLVGLTSAQDRKDFFKKPFDGGRGGELEKARAEVKALETQIERLKNQIAETTKKLDKMNAPKGKEEAKKDGRPDGKGPPWMRGGEWAKKPGGPGRPGFGGPPSWGGRPGFGGPPSWGRGWGPPPGFRPSGFRPPMSAASPSRDLTDRVNRLERAVEDLRRDARRR